MSAQFQNRIPIGEYDDGYVLVASETAITWTVGCTECDFHAAYDNDGEAYDAACAHQRHHREEVRLDYGCDSR